MKQAICRFIYHKLLGWKAEVNVPDGYYLDKESYMEGVNNMGYPYRFYRLIKLSKWSELYK